jgi:hypothetical protein
MRRAGVPPIERKLGGERRRCRKNMKEKPEVRHCPVCGTAMVAEKSPGNPEARLRFSCLNCGAVIVLSRHRDDDGPKPE